MNYFVEGLQGSGKSTFVEKLFEKHPECTLIREGDYSPIELAWCAYLNGKQYEEILEKYPDLNSQIKKKTYCEDDHRIVCYTKIRSENRDFYRDLEQYEIYNGRIPLDRFEEIVMNRYRKWNTEDMIFECSLFQNIVEDMILFHNLSDEQIMDFYYQVKKALYEKTYRIIYLRSDNIEGNICKIRKERIDEHGNEVWFELMMEYFGQCPYAKENGCKGESDLIAHLKHRQDLELRICKEIFPECSVILKSKDYSEEDII